MWSFIWRQKNQQTTFNRYAIYLRSLSLSHTASRDSLHNMAEIVRGTTSFRVDSGGTSILWGRLLRRPWVICDAVESWVIAGKSARVFESGTGWGSSLHTACRFTWTASRGPAACMWELWTRKGWDRKHNWTIAWKRVIQRWGSRNDSAWGRNSAAQLYH